MAQKRRQSLESSLANEFVFGSDERPRPESLADEISRLKAELSLLKSQPVQPTLISINKIVPLRLPDGMKQPRKYFDSVALDRLKDSIDKHGVCEPILTRVASDGLFEIISGERRWRCASTLGHSEIPGVVREMEDGEALEIALIAHLLSENISSVEETDSLIGLVSLRTGLNTDEIPSLLTKVRNAQVRKTDYSGIIEEEKLSDIEAILGEFGISLASFVANRLPLLALPDFILKEIRNGKVNPSKALLIGRTKPDIQKLLIEEVSDNQLTKAQLRQRIAEIKKKGTAPSSELTNSDGHKSDNADFEDVQALYSRVSRKIKKMSIPLNRKMQIRIDRIETALKELLSELEA